MDRAKQEKDCCALYDDTCLDEIKQCNKHNIIVRISDTMGDCPGHICKAEKIFDAIKYDVARYILEHEYDGPEDISNQLLLWLEEKSSPKAVKKLTEIIDKYLSC